jgi:peptide-methionine (S)-S-oxide reductase
MPSPVLVSAGALRRCAAQSVTLALLASPLAAQATRVAVFAGGCFWGVEGVFEHTKGVTSAVSGYSGGSTESVRVTYDPSWITYDQLLEIFFVVAHDPTQLNRQGPDIGPQYRSAVFYADPEEQRAAQDMVARLTALKTWPGGIVTAIEPLNGFQQAEPYHQDYLVSHLTDPYVVINDLPKLALLKKVFPSLYRPTAPAR